ncbi:hypothetical protein [Oscillibacter sp.]|uniref:hypothetical protein n=1 Tax=Oscillibacter sp. TaxID=1945593 RepID=UPI00289B904F|nr:hypothetical protein [Oscillibacter sp.]
MANKVDTSNQGKWGNASGWDLVGGGSSSSKSSSSGSSKASSSGGGSSGGSSSAYDKNTGVDYSRNQSLAGQTVRQGMYDVTYDELGYAKSGAKTSDSPGYIVDGNYYSGNGTPYNGTYRDSGGNYVAQNGVDQGTDYQALINAAKAKGDLASAAVYEQLRNEKINSPDYTGSQSATSLYGSYLPSSVSQKQQNYGTWEDFLKSSGYQDYNEQVQAAIKAAVDAATQSYTQQIDTTNQDSAELARQAYVAKMLGQKNLDQQLSASGYAGGMADSQRIQTESNYQNNLNSIEQQRLATTKELQSAISQAQLSGNQQMAESLSSYLQNLQSQWSSYIQQQQSMSNADYWNQKQMDNSDYWNQQSLDTQNQTTARTNAMELLSAGIMPDSTTLAAAGLSQTEAAAIRSVYLNSLGAKTGTVTAAKTTGTGGTSGGYSNGSLTTAQVQQLQKKLGVTADGKWGSASSAKAGGLTAEQAWAKYGGNTMSDAARSIYNRLTHAGNGYKTASEVADAIEKANISSAEKEWLLNYLGY